ncbi:MAG: hypothetical protein AVDCRST_MAG93-3362 [uncultured Chloroflexia bacterium]|uniref:Uncharacterized protein n=1 Tax=uncultured Chloroflexia bacterium TaxID=1672391 RepID=A0A6J4JNS6_9CHLR|nr:MAG: hypothetical protein AVDCRST_MAG93-3362 [uncultured Chloroflexia bacterium]
MPDVLSSEVVDFISRGGHQVRRVSRGPGGAEVVENPPDRYRRVRIEQVREGALVTQRLTPLGGGSGVPPAGADRTVVEAYCGQPKTAAR